MMLAAMRICIVYDCLFPHTVGGAERWYRNLAERLAADGHEVTYLTLRQWAAGRARADRRARAGRDGGPADGALHASGRRRILPPLVFGLGVLVHLLRHGRRYDVRAHLRVPLLLAAGRGAACARWRASSWSSTGSRCGAAPTGATTSAAVGRARRRARAAPLRARPPARLLLLRAARRRACARRACAAR